MYYCTSHYLLTVSNLCNTYLFSGVSITVWTPLPVAADKNLSKGKQRTVSIFKDFDPQRFNSQYSKPEPLMLLESLE